MNRDDPDVESPPDYAPISTVRARLPGPGFLAAVGWVAVLIVVQFVLGIALAIVALIAGVDVSLPIIAVAVTGNLIVAALIVGFAYGPAGREKLAVRSPGAARLLCVFALALPLLLIVGEASEWLADAARAVGVPNGLIEIWGQNEIIEAIGQMNPVAGTISVIIFGALFPALGEELLFRGYIGRGLVARWGMWKGVLLTSLLFGAVHIHPLHAVVAAFLGVILHALYLWTRSLIVPMLLHGINNYAAIQIPVSAKHGQLPLAAEAHLPPLLALTALLAVLGIGFLLYRSRVRWARADGTAWSPWFATAETPPPSVGARLQAHPIGILMSVVAIWLYLLFALALWLEVSR